MPMEQKFDLDEIRALLKIASEADITELTVESPRRSRRRPAAWRCTPRIPQPRRVRGPRERAQARRRRGRWPP